MAKEYFVKKDSIVREIWGDADNVLFVFGACAAEFALSKSVDWLFFTGKLPKDPISRLFSTVVYAQKIIFDEQTKAFEALKAINAIHKNIENERGYSIPNWAYKDVLYMLIEYSISTFELLNHRLSFLQKEEIFQVFGRVGLHMGIENLPENYQEWREDREKSLKINYSNGEFTKRLFYKYKVDLGWFSFKILSGLQQLLLPKELKRLLNFEFNIFAFLVIKLYSRCKNMWPIKKLKFFMLPHKHHRALQDLENPKK